jgi:hypothetical protein
MNLVVGFMYYLGFEVKKAVEYVVAFLYCQWRLTQIIQNHRPRMTGIVTSLLYFGAILDSLVLPFFD